MSTSSTAAAEAMSGPEAMPRDNGAFVFDEPWEGQAFGLAVAVVDRLGLPWREFQQRLIAAIAAEPERPYYENWAVALESLVLERAAITPQELDQRSAASPS